MTTWETISHQDSHQTSSPGLEISTIAHLGVLRHQVGRLDTLNIFAIVFHRAGYLYPADYSNHRANCQDLGDL